ncbi:GNAT family N-acetyltransferase [Candidatus Eisenbacteria bacterium]|uniref:GNAT family N-acetyltransferase n=1 Tax=Eiseniibacteriota bacterium TaxID=2212470 RepID=A0ABV6YMN5_UNCEI
MAERIEIRSADSSDLDLVMQDGCISLEALKEKVAHEEVVVATRDAERVGYARVEFLWSTVPYISMIWVLEEHRGLGISRALLWHLESRFRSDGYTALYSSSDANEPEPQAWHRHMGFVECGFIAGINAGGVGEIIFRKVLGSDRDK